MVQRPGFSSRSYLSRVLEQFYQLCLCCILGIKWQGYVSNREVLKKASLHSITHLATGAAGGGWLCHKDGRHMHAQSSLLQWAPRRKVWCGAWRKHYKDQLKRQLAQLRINIQSWQQESSDQDRWRSSVRKAIINSRQRGMKPQRKYAGGRKREQHPNHPQPKPSPVQSSVRSAHRELNFAATNKHAKIDHQPSQGPLLRGIGHLSSPLQKELLVCLLALSHSIKIQT